MKKSLSLLAFTVLLISNIQAQGFKERMHHRQSHSHICAGTIVGIAALSTGVVATLGGLLLDISAGEAYSVNTSPGATAQFDQDHNTAVAVRDIGIGLIVVGGVCLISGISYDKQHKHKLSIVSPKRNEFGFAYNF